MNEILDWCAGVPLALRLVAERAGWHDPSRLDVVTDELRDDRARLELLDMLADVHLIDPAEPGRFRMLPTTQAYAAELACSGRPTTKASNE